MIKKPNVHPLRPGKLPGLFAAITWELLHDFPTDPTTPGSDVEIAIRRKWATLAEKFAKYGINVNHELDFVAAGYSLNQLLHDLPKTGQIGIYDSADLIQYSHEIHMNFAEPNERRKEWVPVKMIRRPHSGNMWELINANEGWSPTFKDQMIEFPDDSPDSIIIAEGHVEKFALKFLDEKGLKMSANAMRQRIDCRRMNANIRLLGGMPNAW